MRAQSAPKRPDWAQLLVQAVSVPGTLSGAYRQFWNYSVGNQLLAWIQCLTRQLQPGPINTFIGWQKLGRSVKKGETAIALCMPVSVKRKARDAVPEAAAQIGADADGESTDKASPAQRKTVFVYRPRWFVLCQTDGAAYVPTELPAWSESRALDRLSIERVDFTHTNGNCLGFARERQVAISPLAEYPHKTLFHEIAHVVLGHTAEGQLEDHDLTPRDLREVEAESVALICCESLNLAGTSDSRGYIQHWLSGATIPDKSAQRIFKAADAILKAGYPELPSPETE